MVQTISHRFNTHVKRLSLSASVVIIITRLLTTSKIITQYFNHLLLFNFTTSPLKIDEPLSKVSNGAKIRNRYNQVPHLTQDTNGKVTNSQKTPQTRAKRSALSQQVTKKHI